MTIPYRPDSPATLLRAACILRVRICAARIGDWRPVSPRFEERTVVLDLALLAVPKGEVGWGPDTVLHLTVTQTANRGPRFVAVPGVWSKVDLSPGQELIAFSGAGDTAASLLAEPCCFRLSPASEVETDLLLADRVADPDAPLESEVDRIAATAADEVGPLLAQALADLVWDDPATQADDGLAAVLRLLHLPPLPSASRWVLLSDLVSGLLLRDPAPEAQVSAVVRACFALLADPQAETLHENLITTYLPNLLGLEGGAAPQTAQAIFPDVAERTATAQSLERHPQAAEAGPLVAWLRS